MPIRVYCKSCGATINAPDQYAGQRVKCPKCSKPLMVPNQPAPVPPTTIKETPSPPLVVTDRSVKSSRDKSTSIGVWSLACVILCGATFLGGYLVGKYPTTSLRNENRQQKARLASLDRQLADVQGTAASALESAEELQSQISDYSQADAVPDRNSEEQLDRERTLAVAEYIVRRRRLRLNVAFGMMDEQEQAAVNRHLKKLERGEKLAGSEYLWLSKTIYDKVGEHVLPYEFALKVDWSDMPDYKAQLDRLDKALDGSGDSNEFAKRLSNASGDERLLLIYDHETARFREVD